MPRIKSIERPGRFVVQRLAAIACGAAVFSMPLETAAAAPKRVRPREFPQRVTELFFPDANKLLPGPAEVSAAEAGASEASTPRTSTPGYSKNDWPRLISDEVLEGEIKSQAIALTADVQNAARFKSGTYKAARQHMSLLAAMFSIDAQYGKPARWQREAPLFAERLNSAARNCQAGTDETLAGAKAMAEDLANLLRGDFQMPREITAGEQTTGLIERTELMKRLEQARLGLESGTARGKEFSRRADMLAHEAQLIAALAQVIQREGYEFADDEAFSEDARAMCDSAITVREAIENKRQDGARQAVAALGKICAHCHEGYRN